jgi:hypothetical protein
VTVESQLIQFLNFQNAFWLLQQIVRPDAARVGDIDLSVSN